MDGSVVWRFVNCLYPYSVSCNQSLADLGKACSHLITIQDSFNYSVQVTRLRRPWLDFQGSKGRSCHYTEAVCVKYGKSL